MKATIHIIIKSCNNLLQYSTSFVKQSSMFFFFFEVSVLIHSFLLLEVLNLSKSIFSISLFSDFPFLLFDYKGLWRSDRHPLFMYFCHLLLLFIMYFFQPLTPFCHFDKLFHLILLLILVMHPFFSCIMIVCNNYNDQILYFNLFPFFSHICIVDKHFMVSYVYIYKKKESTIMLLGQTLTGIITITRVNITIT